jgi:RNA polymerase-binding transcription factor DksA
MRLDAHDEIPTAELIAECRAQLERLRGQLVGDASPPSSNRLARVERALSWLGSGHYGYCGICRAPLDEHSLREAPDRLACEECSRPRIRPKLGAEPLVQSW